MFFFFCHQESIENVETTIQQNKQYYLIKNINLHFEKDNVQKSCACLKTYYSKYISNLLDENFIPYDLRAEVGKIQYNLKKKQCIYEFLRIIFNYFQEKSINSSLLVDPILIEILQDHEL